MSGMQTRNDFQIQKLVKIIFEIPDFAVIVDV